MSRAETQSLQLSSTSGPLDDGTYSLWAPIRSTIPFGVDNPPCYPGASCDTDQSLLSAQSYQTPYRPTSPQPGTSLALGTSGIQVPSFGKQKSCDKPRLQCSHKGCTKSFVRRGDLNRHARKHEPGAANIHCPQAGCKFHEDKGFYRRDKLLSHCKVVHKLSPGEVWDLEIKIRHDRNEELEPGFCERILAERNVKWVALTGRVMYTTCQCWWGLPTAKIGHTAPPVA